MPKTVNRLIMYSLASTHTEWVGKHLMEGVRRGRMLRIYYAKMFWRPEKQRHSPKSGIRRVSIIARWAGKLGGAWENAAENEKLRPSYELYYSVRK